MIRRWPDGWKANVYSNLHRQRDDGALTVWGTVTTPQGIVQVDAYEYVDRQRGGRVVQTIVFRAVRHGRVFCERQERTRPHLLSLSDRGLARMAHRWIREVLGML